MLVDGIGYIALIINLYSMSAKGEYRLRLVSLMANVLYILYGVLIAATPIIVGCIVATLLHAYHLRRIKNEKSIHGTY